MSNDRADALGSAVQSHSPGPWEVAYLDNHGQRVVRAEHIEVCTCWHHCVGSIEREMEANARLIAAAPDLLTLAKIFLGHDARFQVAIGGNPIAVDAMVERASAIVAKAEGQS